MLALFLALAIVGVRIIRTPCHLGICEIGNSATTVPGFHLPLVMYLIMLDSH